MCGPEMGDAFREIVHELAGHKGLRAVIVRGAGGDFSIGGQRDMLVSLASDAMDAKTRRDFMLDYYDRWLSVIDIPVPVIAAIEGECLGVAPVFAFLSDIALADETTHFEITFAAAQAASYSSPAFRARIADYLPDHYDGGS